MELFVKKRVVTASQMLPELAVWEAGSSSGLPLVLVHGSCTTSDYFADAVPDLACSACVVVYDRRGYGESGTCNDYSVTAQAGDLLRVVDVAGGRAAIVAHSAGSVMAMEFAARHPEEVATLILFEPILPFAIECPPEFVSTFELVRQNAERGKYNLAARLFLTLMGPADAGAAQVGKASEGDFWASCEHFIRDELDGLFAYEPDFKALKHVDLSVVVSDMPHGDQYPGSARALINRAGARLAMARGYHNFPRERPHEFAELVKSLVAGRS